MPLQSNRQNEVGYYAVPKTSVFAPRPEDAVFDKHLVGLLAEDKILLGNGASASVPSLRAELLHEKQKKDHKTLCVRCRNAHYKAQFNLDQYTVESVASIMEQMPPHAHIVYVVSAADFPMSLNDEVFRYRPASGVQFVVTKSDLFFAKNTLASKYGLRFFQDYLWRTYRVPEENVHVVSGTKDWNTERLMESVKDETYFVGSVNSGKSTLIQSLLHAAQKVRGKLPNARRDRAVQKIDDRAIATGQKPQSRQALIKHDLAAIAKFKHVNGPGALYMPGFTRGTLPFALTPRVTVYDVPGFSDDTRQLYDFLRPEHIKQLHKGQKVHKKGMYTSHYDTAKAGQVVTVGGLFFFQVPDNSMFRIRNCISHPFHIFRSMERALEAWKNPGPALKNVFLVDPATELVRHIVPTFYGSVDLVVRHLGHVAITPTGAKSAHAQPLVVHLPKGVEAIIRQPIGQYISRTLAGRDARGNALRKENWVSKSVTEVKRYSGKNPLTSKIIEVLSAEVATDAEVMKRVVERIKGIAADEVTAENKYANWI